MTMFPFLMKAYTTIPCWTLQTGMTQPHPQIRIMQSLARGLMKMISTLTNMTNLLMHKYCCMMVSKTVGWKAYCHVHPNPLLNTRQYVVEFEMEQQMHIL
jgi:hypothetical protein